MIESIPADASAPFAISASGRLPNVLTTTSSGCCIPALYAAGKTVGGIQICKGERTKFGKAKYEIRKSMERWAVMGTTAVTGRGGLTEKRGQTKERPASEGGPYLSMAARAS